MIQKREGGLDKSGRDHGLASLNVFNFSMQYMFCMVSLTDQEAKLSNTVHTSWIKQAGNLTVSSFHRDKTIQSEWAETFCLKPGFVVQFYLFPLKFRSCKLLHIKQPFPVPTSDQLYQQSLFSNLCDSLACKLNP